MWPACVGHIYILYLPIKKLRCENTSVSVFNTLGKAVYVGKVGFNNMGVQIPQSGTYIVRVGKSISKIEIR